MNVDSEEAIGGYYCTATLFTGRCRRSDQDRFDRAVRLDDLDLPHRRSA